MTQDQNCNKPVKSSLVPVTSGMLYEMEMRLTQKIDGSKNEMKSDMHEIKSDINGIKAELHRVTLIVEEQNAHNKFVLDGYTQIYDVLMELKAAK